jgi:ppGpp synthetase/RelA/SpoT-type nucleotidyltranferase/regulator of sirC expression with transglutaminase-like and TPR domain
VRFPERRKLEAEYNQFAAEYELAAHRVSGQLGKLFHHAGINASIKFRIKSFESYFNKLLRIRGENGHRTALTDVVGFRIICPFIADLDAVESILRTHFKIIEREVKGEENSFREFGYASTHLMIDLAHELPAKPMRAVRRVAEVQLRTILQDAWAEVEHELIYKAGASLLDAPVKRKLASLNATLTLSDIIFQEIRDYVREVHQHEDRRKASIQAKVLELEARAPQGLEQPPSFHAEGKRPNIQHKNEVDRLIFEALEAHSREEFVRAVEIYSRVLRMRTPRHIRSVMYNHRGMAYLALSQYPRAMKDFDQAVQYNPENFRAFNNRALTHRLRQEYKAALEDLDQSLEVNPIQTEGYYIRALTHFDLQDYSKALQDCERVLNIQPDFSVAQHLKGVILSKATK